MASTHQLQIAEDTAPRAEWPPVQDHCPMARTLGVISTRSAFLILREAFYGATRFDEFVQRAEVSEPVAAARLKELVGAGLLTKVPYQEPGARTRHAYALTDQGADFFPVLVALGQWGTRWLPDPDQRISFRHADCHAPVTAQLTCREGHAVAPGEVEITRGAKPPTVRAASARPERR